MRLVLVTNLRPAVKSSRSGQVISDDLDVLQELLFFMLLRHPVKSMSSIYFDLQYFNLFQDAFKDVHTVHEEAVLAALAVKLGVGLPVVLVKGILRHQSPLTLDSTPRSRRRGIS